VIGGAKLGAVRALAVHHVSINVDDVDAAVAFYVDVLGLVMRQDRPPDLGVGGVWLDAGGQQVHLIHAPPPSPRGQHFALLVDDLDAAVSDLRARDVKVSDPAPVGRSHQSFLNDPAGNLIELHQATP
jgi:catechol 2,3-dioxygenase-like lactoylglutathione lyase family enzyme